jgi:hypothetical protein
MTDQTHDNQPNEPVPAEEAPQPFLPDQPYPPAPVARPRLRDRVFRIRGVVAVAVAGLILGGAGGTLVGATAFGDGHGDGPGRGFGGPGGFQQFPQQGQLPQGGPGQGLPGGQLPPGTSPQNDVQPDDSGNTSGTNT